MNPFPHHLLRGVQGWLAKRPPLLSSSKRAANREAIRQAMIDALGPLGRERFPEVERRIRYAEDTHTLWYLRPTLALALASVANERAAFEKLQSITARFAGQLPRAMTSRLEL